MGNRQIWKRDVEEQLERLKSYLLGEDIPLGGLIPTEIEDRERASWLADLLAFRLAEERPWVEKNEMLRAKRWLYAALKYLGEKCDDGDYTFAGLKKLLDLGEIQRFIMFENAEPKDVYLDICNDDNAPEPLSIIERVYLNLVPESVCAERKRKLSELRNYITEK